MKKYTGPSSKLLLPIFFPANFFHVFLKYIWKLDFFIFFFDIREQECISTKTFNQVGGCFPLWDFYETLLSFSILRSLLFRSQLSHLETNRFSYFYTQRAFQLKVVPKSQPCSYFFYLPYFLTTAKQQQKNPPNPHTKNKSANKTLNPQNTSTHNMHYPPCNATMYWKVQQ